MNVIKNAPKPIAIVAKKMEPNDSVPKDNIYKFSNVSIKSNNNKIAVDFLLSKKKSDNKLSNGVIYVEAIDNNQKSIATSSKSNFKFTTARLSKFELDLPGAIQAKVLKVNIIENLNGKTETISSLIDVKDSKSL